MLSSWWSWCDGRDDRAALLRSTGLLGSRAETVLLLYGGASSARSVAVTPFVRSMEGVAGEGGSWADRLEGAMLAGTPSGRGVDNCQDRPLSQSEARRTRT